MALIPFVKWLPTASGGGVEVVVHEIAPTASPPARCTAWASQIHEKFIQADSERTDQDWSWRRAIPNIVFRFGVARRPRMFQLCLKETDFPLGMIAFLENERWIANPAEPALFVWYLTGAPKIATAQFGHPRMLTTATLDIAVSVSLSCPAVGRLWLHAAPKGGSRLLAWYRKQGLDPVPPDIALPQPGVARRRNDGRYFQMVQESAVSFCRQLDKYR